MIFFCVLNINVWIPSSLLNHSLLWDVDVEIILLPFRLTAWNTKKILEHLCFGPKTKG